MMRPHTRALIAGLFVVAALPFAAPRTAMAGVTAPPGTGIVVNSGTVQPVGDPNYLYQFDVALKPDPLLHDFIQKGDNFTIDLTGNNGIISGTNGQPLNWSASNFTPDTVTWTYIGSIPILATMDLDPIPGPFFQVVSLFESTGGFTYSFHDSLPGDPGGNSGGGTFTISAVPEPSSLLVVGLGAPLMLYLLRRSRRGPVPA